MIVLNLQPAPNSPVRLIKRAPVGEIDQFCKLDASAEMLLKAAMRKLQLSARAYHRVLKVSRTIAELAASDIIRTEHMTEAVQYRPRTLVN